MQEILVCISVGVALIVFFQWLYRKWNILKRNKKQAACEECPLKKTCNHMNSNLKGSDTSCSCS